MNRTELFSAVAAHTGAGGGEHDLDDGAGSDSRRDAPKDGREETVVS
ncbi:MAG: hypothetical protein M3083_01535 [Actinomycetota bacterium]|nr:hypothetical protein [Actinomycetota bacterium]